MELPAAAGPARLAVEFHSRLPAVFRQNKNTPGFLLPGVFLSGIVRKSVGTDAHGLRQGAAAIDDDLGTGAESEGNGENTNIEKPTHGRSTEGYLTDTSQKGSVGDVDDILRKQAQENRVTDTPDLFVGIH